MKSTDLGKTYGYPFCMVWSYLPKGVQLTTGSLDKVCDHLAKFPTHHACVHWYNLHRVESKSWRVFGKDTEYKQKEKYYINIHYIQNLSDKYSFSSGKEIFRSKLYDRVNRNHKYLITLKNRMIPYEEDQYLYMKSYRRMPKAYMKDWKNIEKIKKVLV